MKMKRALAIAAVVAATLTAGTSAVATGGKTPKGLTAEAEAFTRADRNIQWDQVQKLKLDFPAFHPQDMSLVGDKIFLSSVEILEPTPRYPLAVDGHDRTTGKDAATCGEQFSGRSVTVELASWPDHYSYGQPRSPRRGCVTGACR